jgi:hypothetical protein
MLAIILAGVLAAVISLIRREQPSIFPILGVVANMVLVGLFWHLRFYVLGFDQDRWAPRESLAAHRSLAKPRIEAIDTGPVDPLLGRLTVCAAIDEMELACSV